MLARRPLNLSFATGHRGRGETRDVPLIETIKILFVFARNLKLSTGAVRAGRGQGTRAIEHREMGNEQSQETKANGRAAPDDSQDGGVNLFDPCVPFVVFLERCF